MSELIGDRYVVFIPKTSEVVGYEVTSTGGARKKLWSYKIEPSLYRGTVKVVKRSYSGKDAARRLFDFLSPE